MCVLGRTVVVTRITWGPLRYRVVSHSKRKESDADEWTTAPSMMTEVSVVPESSGATPAIVTLPLTQLPSPGVSTSRAREGGPAATPATVSATGLPPFTCLPPAGLWSRTVPSATLESARRETLPTVKPAAVIESVASASVDPTSDGTVNPDTDCAMGVMKGSSWA